MTNLYHIIDKIPIYEKYGIEIEYEELANALVGSGLIRIDAGDKRNFIRFSDPTYHINKALSYRELHSPSLKTKLYQYFESIYNASGEGTTLDKKVQSEIEKLKKEFLKLQQIGPELELKLARLFVQSAHPIVTHFLLIEQVEVFIAYSHAIGDVMDIQTWQAAGQNSGMQSTDGRSAIIYVSCGGDPFGEGDILNPTYGDQWPAIARLQIIAAQELGHYADMIRNTNLQYIGRHSANITGTMAKENIKQARRIDIKNCKDFIATLERKGLNKLIQYEEALKFFRKNKIFNFRVMYNLVVNYYYRHQLIAKLDKLGIQFTKKFIKDRYFGLMLKALVTDMLFNLSPIADVYKRTNKDEEEAISCIEALARVPQQVIKWGHLPTKYLMQNLYNVYYGEVIPALINTYKNVTSKPYIRNYKKHPYTFKQRFVNFIQLLPYFKNQKSFPSREV